MASRKPFNLRTPSRGPVATVTRNEAPFPGVLRPRMSPPSISARLRLMVKPSPVPPNRRVVELSACEKGWKIAAICSAAIPTPVSLTSNPRRGLGLSAGVAIATSKRTPPRSVNLMALPSRLMRIWRRRVGSLWMVSGIGPRHSTSSEICLLSARAIKEVTSPTTLPGEQAMRSTVILPASILEMLRMSLMIPSKCLPLRCTVSRNSARSLAVSSCFATRSE